MKPRSPSQHRTRALLRASAPLGAARILASGPLGQAIRVAASWQSCAATHRRKADIAPTAAAAAAHTPMASKRAKNAAKLTTAWAPRQ